MNNAFSNIIAKYNSNKPLSINVVFILLFNFIWAFGNPMVYASTIIPDFMHKMQAQPIVDGLILVCTSAPVIIQLLPRFVDMQLNNTKKLLVIIYTTVGAGYVLFGLVAVLSEGKSSFVYTLLALYFLIYTVYLLGSIVYLDYITRIFPPNILGRFYGIQGTLMSIGALIGGLIVRPILRASAFPKNYGILFITAGVLFAISSFCCVFTVDVSKKDEIAKTVKSVRKYIKDVGPVFKQPIVLLFAALMGLIYLNNTPYGFIISYMSYEKMQAVDPSTVTMIAYLSQAIILPIIGFCLDKYGRMRTISTYLILCIASLTVLLTPFKYGYILVYIMYGTYALFISMAKIRVANEVVAAQNRFDVIVFVNVFGVLIGSVCSAVYGIIVQVTNTRIPIFIISIISSIFIVIVCYKIHQYIAKKNQAKIDRIHSNLNDTERKVYENQ